MADTRARILLVDDEPRNLLALEAVLAQLGQELILASSGPAALDRLAEAEFAAVLLDVRMPGMDGFETAQRIRAMPAAHATPIIFVTAGDASRDSIEAAYALGAVDFLTKPIVPVILTAKVAVFVELHRARQAERTSLREKGRVAVEAAAQRVRASEERYRTLFEAMDEGYCLIDVIFDDAGRPADFRFLETNPAFETHTGLVGTVGKTMRELVPTHEQHWFDTYGQVALTGQARRFVNEAKALGRWYDVYATRLGEPPSTKVAVLFSDITLRKHSDDELRRLAEELSAVDRRKSEFLATLAHELRNPLAPLRNGLHIMRLAADNPAAVARAREMMERQLVHMVHLVDDLLDIARVNSGKLELRKAAVELKTLVASAVETSLPMIDAGGHTLEVDVPDEPITLQVDAVRMAQVLSNLLNNSAKYTARGGRIELRGRCNGRELVITVTDNGIGIPSGSLHKVFDAFTQLGRATGGLGIGLALVRRLIQLHGGTVVVTSPGEGQGSTFELRLPMDEPA